MATTSSPAEGSDCACDPEPTRPVSHHNPPERSQLTYRLGTHGAFLRQMLERLPWQTLPDGPHAGTRPLAGLATHSKQDPTVALLDAFAGVADVLTFYQERIANEGFLRTATESRSMLELGRALGFELSPGLAAGTWLAFTVEEAPGAPAQVVIEPGVRVLSVPGQNERPQTFETLERIIARRELNQLPPITSVPQELELRASELWLQGLQTNLTPGDPLLIVGHSRESSGESSEWELRTVAAVTPDPTSGRTWVGLTPSSSKTAPSPAAGGGKVYALRQRAALFGHNAPDWLAMPAEVRQRYKDTHAASATTMPTEWPKFDVTLVGGMDLYLDNIYPRILPNTWMLLIAGTTVKLCWIEEVKTSSDTNFTLTARFSVTALRDYPGSKATVTLGTDIVAGRRKVIVLGQSEELPLATRPLVNASWGTTILAPFPDVRPLKGPTALDEEDKVSIGGAALSLHEGRPLIISGKRLRARVLAESGITLTASSDVKASYMKNEVLFVVTRPIEGPPLPLEIRRWHLIDSEGFEGTADLPKDSLALEPAHPDDPQAAEVVTIESITQTPARTKLTFTAPLKYWYDRATTTLHGNIAVASHGETVREALGSGDGSQPNQRFTLKRAPVTWVSAATVSGRRSTLEIRVDGVLWSAVDSFHDQGPHSRVYLTQRDEQGRTTVIFGDGLHGARLPTGQENVVATYRIGLGAEGAVDAGKLMLFQTRPLGLRAVTNPLRATGGEAPDAGTVARHEMPVSVLTLDRIVSVTDYETFAQSFAGIGKARAAFLQRGEARRLHLTLALADGTRVPADAVILNNLRAAMNVVRDTTTPVELAGFEPIWFRVAATFRTSPDRLFADVKAAAHEALSEAFSFQRRAFGQGVSAAEVVALLQSIPGVEFVDLDGLAKSTPSSTSIPKEVVAWLPAEEAHWMVEPSVKDYRGILSTELKIQPAQLLLLDPSARGVTLQNRDEVQP